MTLLPKESPGENADIKSDPLSPEARERLILAVKRLEVTFRNVEPEYFPWRETRDPFLILMGEMMLVRTRADLVVQAFHRLAKEYDSAEKLAGAPEDAILEILQPLGLTKRIPFFRRAARYIFETHPEELPADRHALEAIPGVGRYTADAVLAFAFDLSVVPADVNVLRWLSRVTGLEMGNKSKGSPELHSLLPLLAPLGGRNAYQLLDFIRSICRPRKPICPSCPVLAVCTHGRRTALEPEGKSDSA